MEEVFEKRSNLVMPTSCVELDSEEMSYVDGGFYVSNSKLWNILAVCGLNPIGATLIGLGVYKLAALISALGAKLGAKIGGVIGGFVGSAVGTPLGAGALAAIALKYADALIQGKGLDFSWKKTFFGIPYWVDVSVK